MTAPTPTPTPACCRCDPEACEADDTGEHCFAVSCAWCQYGCPRPETDDAPPCCQDGAR